MMVGSINNLQMELQLFPFFEVDSDAHPKHDKYLPPLQVEKNNQIALYDKTKSGLQNSGNVIFAHHTCYWF